MSSEYSSIHVDNMGSLVAELDGGGRRLRDTIAQLKDHGRVAAFSHPAFDRIGEIAGWTNDQVPHLRRRLSLATAQSSGFRAHAARARVKEGHGSKARAAHKGRRLAKLFQSYHNTDKKLISLYRKVLGQLGDDPDVASAFFGSLDVREVQIIPAILGELKPRDADKILAGYSDALGHAFKDHSPPPGFKKLRDQLTTAVPDKARSTGAWTRLALFQHGDFPPGVLATMAKASGLRYLQDDPGGSFSVGRGGPLGISDDPRALALSMLGKDPSAAREAFAGLNLTAITKKVYGSDNNFDGLLKPFARAMLLATGSTTEKMGHHSKGALDFTKRFIAASASVKDVPKQMKGALGHIAAKWAPELLMGANLDSSSTGNQTFRPPGLHLSGDLGLNAKTVYRFLHGFGDNDKYSAEFDKQMSRIYVESSAAAARMVKKHPSQGADTWKYTQGLFGNLAGLEYAAQRSVRKDADEAERARKGLLAAAFNAGVGFIPGAKLVKGLAWKAITFGVGRLTAAQVKPGSATQALDDSDARAGFLMKYQIAAQLIDAKFPGSGKLTVMKGKHGELRSPEEFLKDPELAKKFSAQMGKLDNLKDNDDFASTANDGTVYLISGHADAVNTENVKDFESNW